MKQTETEITNLPTDGRPNSAFLCILLVFSDMGERAAGRAGISGFFLLVPPVGELLCKERRGMNSWQENAGWFAGMSLRS